MQQKEDVVDVVAHHQVALMKTEDPKLMGVLIQKPDLRGLIWLQLEPGLAVVNPERLALLNKRLKAHGYSSKYHGSYALLVESK